MSDTLVYALEVVNARHDAVSSRSASTADGSTPETASPRLSGRDGGTGDGVFDLCRALFRYCVWSLWESSGGETVGSDKEGEFQAVSQIFRSCVQLFCLRRVLTNRRKHALDF